jgi:uncharacterized membrane protein
VGIFPLFKTRPFFSAAQQEQIVAAIKLAEQQTSGEIRVYAESKNPLVDTVERAKEIFYKLKMEKTAHRNGVLVYLAWKHKEIALFGDEGIYTATGKVFWENEIQQILVKFSQHDLTDGIINCIHHIGQALKEKFPFEKTTDKNELPDEIVFGK